MMKNMSDLAREIIAGRRLGYDEAVELAHEATAEELCGLADALRTHFHGRDIDTCSIMNARSGRCPEDCKWCSQSKFHKTDIDIYPLVGVDEALEMARHNEAKGVRRFSLVTSGRTMTDAEIGKTCEIVSALGRECRMELCASLGLLSKPQLQRLFDCGVRRYHCNLETAPSYFPSLCSTHTTEDKIRTIGWAREVGMSVCSGGIIGMGESLEQRIELAVTLRGIGVKSIPVNVLNPIRGTRLEASEPLTDDEVLRTYAMFRIVCPDAHIRFAGGRLLIKHLERRLLHSGVSASIVGDMLTTSGSAIDADRAMFAEEGFTA